MVTAKPLLDLIERQEVLPSRSSRLISTKLVLYMTDVKHT
jgi:hypothetical protein